MKILRQFCVITIIAASFELGSARFCIKRKAHSNTSSEELEIELSDLFPTNNVATGLVVQNAEQIDGNSSNASAEFSDSCEDQIIGESAVADPISIRHGVSMLPFEFLTSLDNQSLSSYAYGTDTEECHQLQCIICYDTFISTDFVYVMHPEKLVPDTAHIFHLDCLIKWEKDSCPMCKKQFHPNHRIAKIIMEAPYPRRLDDFKVLNDINPAEFSIFLEYYKEKVKSESSIDTRRSYCINLLFYLASTTILNYTMLEQISKGILPPAFLSLQYMFTNPRFHNPISLFTMLYTSDCLTEKKAKYLAKELIFRGDQLAAIAQEEKYSFLNMLEVVYGRTKSCKYLRMAMISFFGYDIEKSTLKTKHLAAFLRVLLYSCDVGASRQLYEKLKPFLSQLSIANFLTFSLKLSNRSRMCPMRITEVFRYALAIMNTGDLKVHIIGSFLHVVKDNIIEGEVQKLDFLSQIKLRCYFSKGTSFQILNSILNKVDNFISEEEFKSALRLAVISEDSDLVTKLLKVSEHESQIVDQMLELVIKNASFSNKSKMILKAFENYTNPATKNTIMKRFFLNDQLPEHFLEQAIKCFKAQDDVDSAAILDYLEQLCHAPSRMRQKVGFTQKMLIELLGKMTKDDLCSILCVAYATNQESLLNAAKRVI